VRKKLIKENQSSYKFLNTSITQVADAPIGDTAYNQRILPRQLSSGALRGTQNVGYGAVKIDGSNNRITIGSTTNTLGQAQQAIVGQLSSATSQDQSFGFKVVDASGAQILFGILPDGNLGLQQLDASGNEVVRLGLLPLTKVYGLAAATPSNTLEGQV